LGPTTIESTCITAGRLSELRRLTRRRAVRAILFAITSLTVAGLATATLSNRAAADTLAWALVQAYQNNPSLNAQRAALRATDENVPQALSDYRPKLAITANASDNYIDTVTHLFSNSGNRVTSSTAVNIPFVSSGVGATASETLFNGFQTANRVRTAESQVMGARETLRVTEQQVCSTLPPPI
jgi:outer membrane protein